MIHESIYNPFLFRIIKRDNSRVALDVRWENIKLLKDNSTNLLPDEVFSFSQEVFLLFATFKTSSSSNFSCLFPLNPCKMNHETNCCNNLLFKKVHKTRFVSNTFDGAHKYTLIFFLTVINIFGSISLSCKA